MKQFQTYVHDFKIYINAETELEDQAQKLYAILLNLEKSNIVNGFSFQVGWAVYYLCEKELNTFQITTTDYAKNPFSHITEDLTLALWVQLEQTHFLRKIRVDGITVRFNDKILLEENIFDQQRFYLQRTGNTKLGNSGWYIGPIEGEYTKLCAIYAYELLKIRPEIIQVLALPYDYMVIFEKRKNCCCDKREKRTDFAR